MNDEEPTPEAGEPRADAPVFDASAAPRRHAGYKVLAGILALSAAMAVFLAFQLRSSEHHLGDAQIEFEGYGETADIPGCLDHTLEWYGECAAMAGLCQQSVSRMMGACLAAQDRTTYCESVDGIMDHASFGNDDCRSDERGLDRHMRGACGDAYLAIREFCHRTGGRQDELPASAER